MARLGSITEDPIVTLKGDNFTALIPTVLVAQPDAFPRI